MYTYRCGIYTLRIRSCPILLFFVEWRFPFRCHGTFSRSIKCSGDGICWYVLIIISWTSLVSIMCTCSFFRTCEPLVFSVLYCIIEIIAVTPVLQLAQSFYINKHLKFRTSRLLSHHNCDNFLISESFGYVALPLLTIFFIGICDFSYVVFTKDLHCYTPLILISFFINIRYMVANDIPYHLIAVCVNDRLVF